MGVTHSSCFHLKLINKYHYKWTQNLKQNSMETNHSESFQNGPKKKSFSNGWSKRSSTQFSPSPTPMDKPSLGCVMDRHWSPVLLCWMLGMRTVNWLQQMLSSVCKAGGKISLVTEVSQAASRCFGQEQHSRRLTSELLQGFFELVHHCTAQWAAVGQWAGLSPSPPRMLNRKSCLVFWMFSLELRV